MFHKGLKPTASGAALLAGPQRFKRFVTPDLSKPIQGINYAS